MRIFLMSAVALGTATLFGALAVSCTPGPREGSSWQRLSGSDHVNWMCDGPNMLYYVDGYPGDGFRVVANDPRCKP